MAHSRSRRSSSGRARPCWCSGYLHDNRIVHRDVKPSNLLVGEDGAVKLSDLGLVRHMDRSSDLTRTLEGVGTPRFMAPEQLRGEAPTAACDLYSLGVTLYQLLTGRLPFEGDSAFQVADGHLHAEPPAGARAPPGVSPMAGTICRAVAREAAAGPLSTARTRRWRR